MISQGLTRTQANDLYMEILNSGDTEAMRRLCREDLFFLLTIGCRRQDINNDWLYDRAREVEKSPNGHLDLWAREHYKALDMDTPVWTPDGWKKHGDLKPGDFVYSPNGSKVRVIANTGKMLGSDCYLVGNVVAAGDHLWPTQVKHRPRTKNGRKVVYSTELKKTKNLTRFRLPNISPLRGNNEKLPIDPYVLGVWLGDGTVGGTRITCSHSDANELRKLLEATGIKVSRATHSNSISLRLGSGRRGDRSSSGFANSLRALGLYKDKHVPHNYLIADADQRHALLQGLMDTDGHVNERGTATFVNTNEALVDAVAFLARSLGLRAQKRRYENNHAGYWQVSFQALMGKYCPFRMSRKKKRCKSGPYNMKQYSPKKIESRPVNCIQVEGGLYLAGEELLPTHNSTIITFGASIQDILENPDILIGIFSHTRGIAKGFLDQIKRELENNSYLKKLFPDVLYQNPQNEAPKWSLNDGIIVKRKTNPKESTVEAWGLVDGQPTSKHFTLLVYDDVVTLESVTTPEQIQKTTSAWEMSQNLGAAGGFARYIGTRYHANDTYRTMMERGSVIKRIYPATDNGKMDGKPVFLSPEVLAKKRRDQGPYTFGTQMLQDPVADKAMGFKEEWLKFYKSLGDTAKWNIFIIVDPASKKKSGNDYTSMWVIGLAPDNNYYIIDAIRDRLNLTERAKKLFELQRKYRPIDVGYEEYGLQADIEHMKFMMELENYRFKITPLGGSMSKEDRIKRLIPIFEQGRMWLPERLNYVDYELKPRDLVRMFIDDEYKSFPVCVHDDMLDCMARILESDLNAKFPKIVAPKPQPRPYSGGSNGWMG